MLKNQPWLNLDDRQLIAMTVPFALLTILGCGSGTESNPITSSLSTPKSLTENSTSTVPSDTIELSQAEQPEPTTSESADSLSAVGPNSTEQDSPSLPSEFSEEEPVLTETPTAPEVSVKLDWDHSPDSDISNYYVYYGMQPTGAPGSCNYDQSQAVKSPPATITGLEPNTPYFFAISAFKESESPCSFEFMLVTPSTNLEET